MGAILRLQACRQVQSTWGCELVGKGGAYAYEASKLIGVMAECNTLRYSDARLKIIVMDTDGTLIHESQSLNWAGYPEIWDGTTFTVPYISVIVYFELYGDGVKVDATTLTVIVPPISISATVTIRGRATGGYPAPSMVLEIYDKGVKVKSKPISVVSFGTVYEDSVVLTGSGIHRVQGRMVLTNLLGSYEFLTEAKEFELRTIELRSGILTLRPNAAGDETTIPLQYPETGSHWELVDEVVPDDDSTYVYVAAYQGQYGLDLYKLTDTAQTGAINSIRVYVRGWLYYTTSLIQICIKTGGVLYVFNAPKLGWWNTYSNLWTTNPQTGRAWTWPDINALQAGVNLNCSNAQQEAARCTQVYVEVNYTTKVYL